MSVARSDAEKNLFYKDFYQQVLYLFLFIVMAVYAAAGYLFYQVTHRPLPQFSAVMPDGRGMVLSSYDEPNLMPATLVRWASKAAVAANTFNFVDYKSQIAFRKATRTPIRETIDPFKTLHAICFAPIDYRAFVWSGLGIES